jgi:PAS domain S-box-containing protein
MFASIFQSLTALLFAGVCCYAVFVSEQLRPHRRIQQLLVGLIVGLLVISLGLNAYRLEWLRLPIDAKPGALIFAGYLGGPIGGMVAGAIAVGFRLVVGGGFPILAIFMGFGMPAIGIVLSYIYPPREWPITTRKTVFFMILGFLLLSLVPFTYLALQGNPAAFGGMPFVIKTRLIFASLGAASILLTWPILNYAARFATQARRSADLAARLDLTLKYSGVGIFEYQSNSSEIHFDATINSIYGLDRPAGPVSLDDRIKMIHPEDRAKLQRRIDLSDKGVIELGRVNYRVIRPDGTLRYVTAVSAGEESKGNKPVRIIGVIADYTETRQAEQSHRASVERLALIAQNIPGVVYQCDITDRTQTILKYISPKCVSIWGYTDEEFYAQSGLLISTLDAEDLPNFRAAIERGIETGEPVSYRSKITARDGTERWIDYHGSSSTINGRVIIEAIALDVTREVAVQEQSEKQREIAYRAQKVESIGLLTGGVAHDFNNLLAVILGNLELIGDEDYKAKQPELIEAAIAATLRGADLTKNLLAFARKARLTPEILDLNTVVREAKNWMGRTLPESVVVETSLLAGLWPVEADRSSLESALLNLILNARDAMNLHGNLTIETANVRIDEAYIDTRSEELAPGRYVMLAVSDTGEGIKESDLAAIFEPFFTTKPPGSGSGLGLSMIAGFMRQSGGTVQMYTELGEGTTFKLYFPAVDAPTGQKIALPPVESATNGSGQRILLAEDETAVRETLVTILERAGYDVTATPSGDMAYSTFEADPTFDLLLTDIVMPGTLQGTGLAKALRKRWTTLPVVFMSGYASEATVHGNGLRPEDIRLMKPVQRADLLAALSKVLKTDAP